jgi:hypothetical protein
MVLSPQARIRTLVVAIFRLAAIQLAARIAIAEWFACDDILHPSAFRHRRLPAPLFPYYANWTPCPAVGLRRERRRTATPPVTVTVTATATVRLQDAAP